MRPPYPRRIPKCKALTREGTDAEHPAIKSMFMQFLSVARGLKLFPPLFPIRPTTAPFSDLEMQNMLEGLDRLIEIARPCRDTARAVAAAKKLRDSLRREYWSDVRVRSR
jgi:hypothetical protein